MTRHVAAFYAAVLLACAETSTLETLLGNIALRDDLSQKSMKESDGSVIIFTREDLDRMRITNLGEIIERLPFMRYNENDYGLLEPGYVPFQPPNSNFVKVYVDDREVVDGTGTNGLQLFSQMGLNYIDHIEVYFGGVSFNIGIEPSLAIIKLYTKEPSRENSHVLTFFGGGYGTTDFNFYSAYELEDYSYMLYLEHKRVKRKKYHYNTATLSRNKHINMLYFKLQKGAIRFEANVQNGTYDSFIARTLSLEPKDAKSSLKNIYLGLYYQKDGFKAYSNMSYYNIGTYVYSDKVVGFLPLQTFPYLFPYDSIEAKIDEMVFEGGVSKEWEWEKFHLIMGLRGRYQNVKFLKERYGNRSFLKREYRGTKSVTTYFEGKYLIDASDVALFSFKRDSIYEDVVKGFTRFSYRGGFIRNTQNYTFKLFGIHTAFVPQPIVFIEKESMGNLENPLTKERVRVYATEYKRKFDLNFFSILYSKIYDKNNIIRDPVSGRIYNNENKQVIDSLLFRTKYHINLSDSIELNYFLAKVDYGTKTDLYRGGDISLYKKVDKLDLYTGFIYRDGYSGLKAGYDLRFTINYDYSKNLSFYCKGTNLLGKALKTNYYGYNLAERKVLTLPGVDVIDRTIYVGMEYQF